MRKLADNIVTFLIAVVGVLGGLLWAIQSKWDYEPIILLAMSSIEVTAFVFFRTSSEKSIAPTTSAGSQSMNGISNQIGNTKPSASQREAQIDFMKPKTNILFIDDDKNFNVVKILKDSGWKNTKSVIDIKSLDMPIVKDTDIFFVDINGVGKLLNLEHGGLDLALMLKQKYESKKVVIYSANKNSNSFHGAWDECDFKLEKNALPYQFQNLVEQYSLELMPQNK